MVLAELRGLFSTWVCAASAVVAGVGVVCCPPALADGGKTSVVLLVDSSGSMKESSGSVGSRMDAAKASLRGAVPKLPTDVNVGLMTYGSKISDGAGSCKDVTVLHQVGPYDKSTLLSAVDKLNPLGNTPIAYSLGLAAKQLPSSGSRSIVLVSDGEESCGGDPCAVARKIGQSGVNVHIDVVGLQVDAKARGQLSCIAAAGKGTYYDADNLDLLPQTINRVTSRAARGYAPAGTAIVGGTTRDTPAAMTTGAYLDTIGGDVKSRFYTLPDPGKGTLSVAATIRPEHWDGVTLESVQSHVYGASGVECGDGITASVIGVAKRAPVPVTAALQLSAGDRATCGKGPYVWQVEAPKTAVPRVLALATQVEAAVADVASLPAPDSNPQLASASISSSAAKAATGSPSFSGAPVLEPGRYTDTILLSESLFYAVKLDWGQAMRCDVSAAPTAKAAAALRSWPSQSLRVRAFSPLGVETTGGDLVAHADADYSGDKPASLATGTPVVKYRNRASIPPGPANLAGTYYCMVELDGYGRTAAELGDIPITVDIAVSGTAGEGKPDYEKATWTTAPASTKSASTSDAGSGNASMFYLAGGAAVIAAAAAGGLWVVSRRRPDSQKD